MGNGWFGDPDFTPYNSSRGLLSLCQQWTCGGKERSWFEQGATSYFKGVPTCDCWRFHAYLVLFVLQNQLPFDSLLCLPPKAGANGGVLPSGTCSSWPCTGSANVCWVANPCLDHHGLLIGGVAWGMAAQALVGACPKAYFFGGQV